MSNFTRTYHKAQAARRCEDLGVCQDRTPPCPGCLPRPAFAPGVIEHHRRHRTALARWMWRVALVLGVTGLVVSASFGLGLLAGALQ